MRKPLFVIMLSVFLAGPGTGYGQSVVFYETTPSVNDILVDIGLRPKTRSGGAKRQVVEALQTRGRNPGFRTQIAAAHRKAPLAAPPKTPDIQADLMGNRWIASKVRFRFNDHTFETVIKDYFVKDLAI